MKRGRYGILAVFFAFGLLAAGRVFTSYADVKPILSQAAETAPPELRGAGEAEWLAWAQRHDAEIRARLRQGDLDSMVNLLLYGTSFTEQPRIRMENITEASKSGVLHARVDDLVRGIANPGENERLLFLKQLLRDHGLGPDPKQTGQFILQNLLRVVQERKTLAERTPHDKTTGAREDPAALLDRSSAFRDRGLSLDTGIVPAFSIDRTLRDLEKRGVLRPGQVSRVAVIGPGLDFIDKNEDTAYDYYPEQTLQPFALYDSLVRLQLAKKSGLSVSVLDISSRVIEHVRRARERATKGTGYAIQLPRDIERRWPADLVEYWKSLGDRTGKAIEPIQPPRVFSGLEARAVLIRPDIVLACQPNDLDIVVQRLDLASADRFDLIVATNIFVYYDPFEQSLALENAGAMLKQGGILLTNDRLPEVPSSSMRLAGTTVVSFDSGGVRAREAVGWYQKQ